MTVEQTRSPRRRRPRQRLQLISMSWEELFPPAVVAIITFCALLLFLRTTAKHWPSWQEMGQSLEHGGWVGIGVVVALGVVAAIAWVKDR